MFELKKEKYIDNLKSLFQEFHHECGTKHFHFKSESKENSFIVSFPTQPDCSDGRAHILEHLVLCGSEKFQTHDPFFAMTRRSLATFMNAMTYADKTAYPFATTDKKDFFNLLEVYLDATFFPKLDYHNFLQEGWRYELKDDYLSYSGVVYNEMKGAITDKNHHIFMGIEKNLKIGTTYEHESGGDPLDIPNLSYEELKDFHKTNYHPSKATIMTFGDIDPKEIQDFFEKEVLSKIKNKINRSLPQKSKLKELYQEKIEYFPCDQNIETEEMVILNWLLGESSKDLIDDYQVFSHILTSEGGYLCSSLENAGFGRPSDFIGVFSHSYESTFHLGLEGLKKTEVHKARRFILDRIKDVAQNGVSKKIIEASLDDLESEIKSFNTGKLPYGLSILLSGLPFASNELNPLKGIDHEESLKRVRKKFKNENYIKKLAINLLTKIPLVSINFSPKKDFFEERNKLENLRLKEKFDLLSNKEKEEIQTNNKILLDKQKNSHDYNCLPKISPNEVAQTVNKDLPIIFSSEKDKPTIGFINMPTNGITYINAIFDVSKLKVEDWKWCQLLSVLATGLGTKKDDWVIATEKRSILCKNAEISFNFLNDINKSEAGKFLFEFNLFHLEKRGDNLIKILNEFLTKLSFKDEKRILQIIKQEIADFEQNIATLGNMIAGHELKANFTAVGNFQKETIGLNYINFLKDCAQILKTKSKKSSFIKELEIKYKTIIGQNCVVFGAGSNETFKTLKKLQSKLTIHSKEDIGSKVINITIDSKNVIFKAPTEVNYCHGAFKVDKITFKNKEAVYLDLTSQLLTHNYLHPTIREQRGAYGANASFNVFNGIFNFSSYRDPELSKTFDTFSNSFNWFAENKFSDEQLNEAKISLLQNLDKPTTPKNEFDNTVSKFLMGISEEMRQERKKAIIEASIEDVQNASKKFLKNKTPILYGFSNKEDVEQKLNFTYKEII